MNTPNRLTILRMLLVPVVLFFLLCTSWLSHAWLFACIVFVIASITDAIDGKLARKHGIVTDFGKFLDPLADKILVISVLVVFIDLDLANSIAVILIIAREFVVSGVRLLAATSDGKVISANIWGKLKTTFQMIAIIATMALMELGVILGLLPIITFTYAFSNIMVWVAAAVTVVSGAVYVVQNKQYLSAK